MCSISQRQILAISKLITPTEQTVSKRNNLQEQKQQKKILFLSLTYILSKLTKKVKLQHHICLKIFTTCADAVSINSCILHQNQMQNIWHSLHRLRTMLPPQLIPIIHKTVDFCTVLLLTVRSWLSKATNWCNLKQSESA